MRFLFGGGCYGKEYFLQLITGDGKEVTFRGIRAFNLHTDIMREPKGPERIALLWEIYEQEKSQRELEENES